ncbi:S-layer homology domain-containing protein [Cohnella boryungensis]|uniref:S-layer homology domain-containing protein n=1 Tax=Cohnella boryungensis TaxID=768479 RepID=UPI00195A8C57
MERGDQALNDVNKTDWFYEAVPDSADKDNISTWATDSMKWAVGKGLISGKGKGMLDPSGKVTRAEIAAVLMRFLQQ